MIRKASPKFTKILSHENFEPYGIIFSKQKVRARALLSIYSAQNPLIIDFSVQLLG